MSKKYNYSFSVLLSFEFLAPLIVLFFTTLGAQYVYAQCNVLCMHERGNVPIGNKDSSQKNETGLSLEPNYDVAFNDSYYTQAGGEGDNNQKAANNMETNATIDPLSKKWHFVITPYLWAASLNGKIGVRNVTADVNEPFSDIIGNLDIGLELHAEAWTDKYGFFIDAEYSKLSASGKSEGPLSIKVNDTSWFFLGELGGFYRVGTWPIGGRMGSYQRKTNTSITFDLLGGGRYWYLKNEINFKGPIGVNPSVSGSKNWFDFIVGGRAKLAVNKFFFELRSDVGGFGLGFSSDISWNIAGYIGYELPWYRITPIIGYRALYDKYSNGSGSSRFLYDAWMYGPTLGVAFQF